MKFELFIFPSFRAQEAEILKEELRNAKMAEKFAKDKLLEVSRDSQLYPVVSTSSMWVVSKFLLLL